MEASWDAAVARMGSASPGGLLRRLTTPRASLPGDYAVLEAVRAESALREVALGVGTPDGWREGLHVEAAEKAAAKAEKELKKKIKVRQGGRTSGGEEGTPTPCFLSLTRARIQAAACATRKRTRDASEPSACNGGGGCARCADRPLLTRFSFASADLLSCVCSSVFVTPPPVSPPSAGLHEDVFEQ